MDDTSDILGTAKLRTHETDGWSSMSLVAKVLMVVAGLTTFILALTHVRQRITRWQEMNYKKSTRRRHGIPDSDHRPFNVAYAAVKARQERETKAAYNLDRQPRNALAEVRQRLLSETDRNAQTNSPPAYITTTLNNRVDYRSINNRYRPTPDPLDFTNRYNPDPPVVRVTKPSPQPDSYQSLPLSEPATPRRISRKTLHINPRHDRKRSLDDNEDSDLEYSKKTRVEGEELIDGDEEAEWAQSLRPQLRKGAKRGVDDEDELRPLDSRDKRARQVSRDHTPEELLEAEDEVMELDEVPSSIRRGKKRDRAEAGSTFGADDEDLESRSSRRHKRRNQRKSDVGLRARLENGAEETASEKGSAKSGKSRRRSNKKHSIVAEEGRSGSDASMDDFDVSRDPLCKGRKMGEEWEANGVNYKVGPNGERLRQALIKKARSKFNMPEDSRHPDRHANLEVFVETWLTEENYDLARERNELAWQDTSNSQLKPLPSVAPALDSPPKGKNLLWSSTTSASTLPRSFRQSIASNLGIRGTNPFENVAIAGPATSRRISSAHSMSLESPGRKTFRTFSKWEKQDLEAEAMARMRAKSQEKKQEADKPALATAASTPNLSLGLNAPPAKAPDHDCKPTVSFASTPSFNATPVGEQKPAAPPLFSSPSAPSLTTAANTATDKAKLSSAPTFAWPSAPASTSTPELKPSLASAQPLLFGVPSTASSATPAAPSNIFATPSSTPSQPAMPNFFSNPASLAPSAQANNQTPTVKPPVTQVQAAQPSKPIFSFAAPSTTPASVTPAPSQFGFGPPKPAASAFNMSSKPEEKKAPEASGSFMGRMGGFPNGATQPQTPASAAVPGNGGPIFSFKTTEAPKTANTTAAPASSLTTVPKFNFGTPKTAATSTAQATEPPKTQPVFGGFGTTATNGATSPSASTTATSAPKLSFAGFGNNANSTPAPFKPSTPTLSFGGIGASKGTSLLSTTPVGSPSTFGNGVMAAGGSSQPSNTSSFGSGIGSAMKPPVTNSTFGSSTPGAPAENKFSFNFGAAQNANTSSTPSSVFGSTTGPSAFGFPPTTAAGGTNGAASSPFNFSATGSSQNQKQ